MLWDYCKTMFYQVIEIKYSRNKNIPTSSVVPKTCPSSRLNWHYDVNISLVTSICNSYTTEQVAWQTVSSVSSSMPIWFSLWHKNCFWLSQNFTCSAALGRGNILVSLAWTDATVKSLQTNKFGPGTRGQRHFLLLKLTVAWQETHQCSVSSGFFFLFIYYLSQSKKQSKTHMYSFQTEFMPICLHIFGTGSKHFPLTNVFIFLVYLWYTKILYPCGETWGTHGCLWKRGTDQFFLLHWHSWHTSLCFHLER